MIDRRQLLRAALFVAAAPLIVRSSSIMKIVAPAQGWPYYGGLATLETTSDIYTDNSITSWRYDDGSVAYGLGFVTTGRMVMETADARTLQLRSLRMCCERLLEVRPAYIDWLSKDQPEIFKTYDQIRAET